MTRRILAWMSDPKQRPYAVLIFALVALIALDRGQDRILTQVTAFSILQTFATLGLPALAVGFSMIVGEYDLSVAGMFGMAGCVAVLTGGEHPWLGIAAALAVGIAGGAAQGMLMVRLRIDSVGITLGGLLVFVGVAYVLTESRSITYPNLDVAMAVNDRIAGLFSIRSAAAIALFVGAAVVFGTTRLGRDLVAIGSNCEAARIAGVPVDSLLIGTFALSGALAALAGTLLSYSLASASHSGLGDVLVPATAAAILGGVSLGGGSGRPHGIALGVLTLATLRSGLNALEVPVFASDLTMGLILMCVALLDAPGLTARIRALVAPKF